MNSVNFDYGNSNATVTKYLTVYSYRVKHKKTWEWFQDFFKNNGRRPSRPTIRNWYNKGYESFNK